MAERLLILKASDVMNAPTCSTLQDAIEGAYQRRSVDGQDRVVVAIVSEINSIAAIPGKSEE
jgi:hypothetical protein